MWNLGKKHAAFGMIGVRQRQEALGEESFRLDLFGAQRRQFLPGHAVGQLRARTGLDRFAARHGHALGGTIAEVITQVQQVRVFLLNGRLGLFHAFPHGLEVLRAHST